MLNNLRKTIVGFLVLAASGEQVFACPECRLQVRAEIFGQDFYSNISLILFPVGVILAIGIGLFYADEIKKGVW
jgi:hypothetical protein